MVIPWSSWRYANVPMTGKGGAAASITGRKQKRLIRAAEYFLLRNPQHGLRPCRFDVVALDGDAPADWIRDAFRVPSP